MVLAEIKRRLEAERDSILSQWHSSRGKRMKILVTGGTGSLGQVLVPMLFEMLPIERVRVLSRDEHKQIHMASCVKYAGQIDFLVGDVRDLERLQLAVRDCEGIFHLAAIKSVDTIEYNPNEAVKTNIDGTSNVIAAA